MLVFNCTYSWEVNIHHITVFFTHALIFAALLQEVSSTLTKTQTLGENDLPTIITSETHGDDDYDYSNDHEWEMSTVRGTYDILFLVVLQ